MIVRFISATCAIPVILIAVWMGGLVLAILIGIIAGLAILEFYRLLKLRNIRPPILIGFSWTLSFIFAGYLLPGMVAWIAAVGALGIFIWCNVRYLMPAALGMTSHTKSTALKKALTNWIYSCAGAYYIGWTMSLLLIIRHEPMGLYWVLTIIFGTFATDTGAFMTGRLLGRTLMAPSISPRKTWEGAAGGTVFGTIISALMVLFMPITISLIPAIVLGVLISLAAQIGDLLESALKRASDVKDSGNIIPGHGGILDRADSIVLVIVVVYYFSWWILK